MRHKSWRKGKVPPAVTHQEYNQDESLCVVRTLDEYIAQTERWRSEKSTLIFCGVLFTFTNQWILPQYLDG